MGRQWVGPTGKGRVAFKRVEGTRLKCGPRAGPWKGRGRTRLRVALHGGATSRRHFSGSCLVYKFEGETFGKERLPRLGYSFVEPTDTA